MFRFALRRVLWSIPTVIGLLIAIFVLMAFVPITEDSRGAPSDFPASYSSLPRFINTRPLDLRARTERAVTAIATEGSDGWRAHAYLERAGGAALPFVLPGLDMHSPDARRRVALALAPVGRRMGIDPAELSPDGDRAVRFWVGFWASHGMDYSPSATRRMVERFIQHPSPARSRDLVRLDSNALPDLFRLLSSTESRAEQVELTHQLTQIVGPSQGGGGEPRSVVDLESTPMQARQVLAMWEHYWAMHESEYIPLDGADRVFAMVLQTRYARGILSILGQVRQGALDSDSALHKIGELTFRTSWLTFGSLLLSTLLAVPLGVVVARGWGSRAAHLSTLALTLLSVVPAGLLAAIFVYSSKQGAWASLAALSLATSASLAMRQRYYAREAFRGAAVLGARALGFARTRARYARGLRLTAAPMLTEAGFRIPQLLVSVIVVERLFGVRGLGAELARSALEKDVGWAIISVILFSLISLMGMAVSDFLYALWDPHFRAKLGDSA